MTMNSKLLIGRKAVIQVLGSGPDRALNNSPRDLVKGFNNNIYNNVCDEWSVQELELDDKRLQNREDEKRT